MTVTELRLWGERADNIRPLSFVGTQKSGTSLPAPKCKDQEEIYKCPNGLSSKGKLHKQPSIYILMSKSGYR